MIRVQSCPDFGRMRSQINRVEDRVGVPIGHAQSDLGEEEIETNRVANPVVLGNRRGFDWSFLNIWARDGRKTSISDRLTSSGAE